MFRYAFILLFVLAISSCSKDSVSTNSYHLNRSCDLTFTTCDSIEIKMPESIGLFNDLSLETIQKYKDRYLYYQNHLSNFGAFNNQRNIFIDQHSLKSCVYVYEAKMTPLTNAILEQTENDFNKKLKAPFYELIEKKLDNKNGVPYTMLQYFIKGKEDFYFSLISIESEVGFYEAIIYSKEKKDDFLNYLLTIKKK